MYNLVNMDFLIITFSLQSFDSLRCMTNALPYKLKSILWMPDHNKDFLEIYIEEKNSEFQVMVIIISRKNTLAHSNAWLYLKLVIQINSFKKKFMWIFVIFLYWVSWLYIDNLIYFIKTELKNTRYQY